jgi:hypothetical protein
MYRLDSLAELRIQIMHLPACLNHNRIKSSSSKTEKAKAYRLGYIRNRPIWIKNGQLVVRYEWRSCWWFRYSGMWRCVTGSVIPCKSNDHFTFRVKQTNLGIKQSHLRLLDPWRQKRYNNFKSCNRLLTQQHSDTSSLFCTFLHSCYLTLLGSKCFPHCTFFIQVTKFYNKQTSDATGVSLSIFNTYGFRDKNT